MLLIYNPTLASQYSKEVDFKPASIFHSNALVCLLVYQDIMMSKRFLEIVFEAELDTEEHPELLKLAEELCNEHQDTRAAAIQELRDMIIERGECVPRRMDDQFLLRFLRQRRFVVRRAHRQLVRYCSFLEQYPYLYKGVDLWDLAKMGDVYEGCLLDRPDVGRISIVRFGAWDPDEHPTEVLVQACLAMLEIGLRSPKTQVFGGTLIIDFGNVSMKQIAKLNPTTAHQWVAFCGFALPCSINAVHLINYNWLIHAFLFFVKRLVPKKAWSFVHFHGHDLETLHQLVDPRCLPPRYGGSSKHHVNFGDWLTKIRKYRDEDFDREMKEFGYLIKE